MSLRKVCETTPSVSFERGTQLREQDLLAGAAPGPFLVIDRRKIRRPACRVALGLQP
jgi:hypothetical protein